jgi:23S rRNA (adenine2503-C2)-methyltransferase
LKNKPNILNLTLDELSRWFEQQGIQAYRAGQVMKWLHHHQADAFADMTNLSKAHRQLLSNRFDIRRLQVADVSVSRDGSRKYLFHLEDGGRMESVLMPERGHDTLCVSSQIGCAQGCRFCLTGSGGLERNLNLAEIVSQVRDILNERHHRQPLTNLVFMGMGEPLANYRHLLSALEILTNNQYGYRFANRRITVSTAGLVPKIAALGKDTRVNLAISLNAADDGTRNRLMPINRKYPLEKLIAACRNYPLPSGRRITFEYILLKGVNDSIEDARKLAGLLRPLRCKINLIPFNAHAGCEYTRPGEEAIAAFQQVLLDAHYTTIIRQSKGQDIAAACGQLRASPNMS